MSFLSNLFGGSESARYIKSLGPIVEKIGGLETGLETKQDEELREMSLSLKTRAGGGEPLDELLSEAFAMVREASKRTLKQRPFDVQMLGGIALHRGNVAEMKTGEGKTLVTTLPAYLNALSGGGVHVVTVNDYLSLRNAVWMGQIYNALGLSTSVIVHDNSYLYDPTHTEKDKERDLEGSHKVHHEFLRPCTRREAYLADITYGTNSEFGFDFLRDNIAYNRGQVSMRRNQGGGPAYNYAIIDEVDSILIDEARTPLIISAPISESDSIYGTFAQIATKLDRGVDYKVDEKDRAISMTDVGIDKVEKLLNINDIYSEKGVKFVHHLETAVRALALFHKDKEYVVKENEIIIVDPSTGRLQPGRRWSEGLHQAIEAKEGVKVQEESRTYATISYQNFFRLYKKLSGMTGTAFTSKEEFEKVYNLETIVIPTNKENIRIDRNDLVLRTELGKFKALSRKIKEENDKGRPILVGTVSIEKNELLSQYLKREGVVHEILNAKNHEREGEIIANAGRRGAVTIATNMAGRGVDIKLGGAVATTEESEEVKKLGGLLVVGTERHEARRIDNQLRGRAARQGDPGETQFYVSLEDDLMRIFAPDITKSVIAWTGLPEDEPIEARIISRQIEGAQSKIEGFNFDARKHLLEYDDVMNQQRRAIYERREKILFGDDSAIENLISEIVSKGENPEADASILAEKKDKMGSNAFLDIMKRIMLQTLDMLWVEHLEAMEYMRSSVRLRAYGNRDPLVEYKREGLSMYKELEVAYHDQVLEVARNFDVSGVKEEAATPRIMEEHGEGLSNPARPGGAPDKDVGRNDPCPCGSGKKYKKCHGS